MIYIYITYEGSLESGLIVVNSSISSLSIIHWSGTIYCMYYVLYNLVSIINILDVSNILNFNKSTRVSYNRVYALLFAF